MQHSASDHPGDLEFTLCASTFRGRRSRLGRHTAFHGYRGESPIEGRKPCLMSHRDIEDATVRQFQPAAGTQFSKAERFLAVVRCDGYARGAKVVSHRHPLSYPNAADQHFGHSDRVCKHLSRRAGQEDFGGRFMMRIGRIEIRDQHARVQCNQLGQSALRSVR